MGIKVGKHRVQCCIGQLFVGHRSGINIILPDYLDRSRERGDNRVIDSVITGSGARCQNLETGKQIQKNADN